MMMDQQASSTAAGFHREKPEACDFRAGVEAELGLVTAKGDNPNKSYKSTFHGSDRSGSIHDLVHAVTTFGTVLRKKRMTRQRRSSLINFHHLSFAAPSPFPSPIRPPKTLPPARVSFPSLPFLFPISYLKYIHIYYMFFFFNFYPSSFLLFYILSAQLNPVYR